MALEGLRTLMFAVKVFPDGTTDEYIKGVEDEALLENDLQLVGITALEDLL